MRTTRRGKDSPRSERPFLPCCQEEKRVTLKLFSNAACFNHIPNVIPLPRIIVNRTSLLFARCSVFANRLRID